MQCPIDQTTLAITERQGIEIDYCPQCRGVWLDRGELDKIIEGASAASSAPRPTAAPTRDAHEDRRPQQQYRTDDDYKFKKKKKESFLGDLFDF